MCDINNRVSQMKSIQAKCLELFTRKNSDYGDAFATYGIIGVLIRIQDKISRSICISKSGINLVNDEKIEDTLLDLHNYAAMALMLMEEGKSSISLMIMEEAKNSIIIDSETRDSETPVILTISDNYI